MVYRRYKRSTMTRRYRKKPAVRRIARPKRTYARKNYRKTPYFTVDNSICNPPRRLLATLQSTLSLAIAPGATTNGYVFPLQSGSDPFGANSTNQPRGWDRLAQLYYQYMTYGGTVYLTYTNETTNPVRMIVYVDNESTNTSNSYEEARQQVGAREYTATEAGGSRTMVRCVRKWSTRIERSRGALTTDEWKQMTETGASELPNGSIYLHVNFYSQKSSNAANITGLLAIRDFKRIGFQGLEFTDVDTTTD